MEMLSEKNIEQYQNSPKMCDYRKTCIQHPLVCIVCVRRTNLKDCYKLKMKGEK